MLSTRAVGGMQKCQRQPAMTFNEIVIASFTPQLFGVWFTKRRSSSTMKAICFAPD
jgi:hypothetical protein